MPERTVTPTSTSAARDDGSSGLGDPYFPNAGNGGYDVSSYDLDLRYDPQTDVLDGTAVIQAMSTMALESFYLDFVGFDIMRLEVDGVPVDFERSGGELQVVPPDGIPANQSFEIQIDYEGVPQPAVGPFGERLGWNETEDGAFVLSEPTGAATWYPVNDHPLDKASYVFDVTVPAGLEVVANGTLAGTEEGGDGWTTWTYESPSEMASYLAMVAIGHFVFEEMETNDGIPVRNAYDESFADDAKQNFERTPQMIEFFEERFGPYPFDVYGNAVLDFNWRRYRAGDPDVLDLRPQLRAARYQR
ncbi:MAG: hypothetical protein R3A46_09320 [Thermomicrobiales bacterium]